MSKRRANGEGALRQKADGKWEARLTHVDPDSGSRKVLSFYAPTAKEAAQKRTDALTRLRQGQPAKDTSRTVADWLAHWRQTTLAASDRKQTTRDLYATLCTKHLEPAPFGAIRLDRLRPSDIEGLILRLRKRGSSESRRNIDLTTSGSRADEPERRRPRTAESCDRPPQQH